MELKFNRLLLFAILATALTSCTDNKIVIKGKFIGGESSVVYLEEINTNENRIIDSIPLSPKGDFTFVLSNKDKHHKLFNIVYDWSQIPLFAANGDRIEVNSIGNVSKNYTVTGSEESELVRQFYQPYIAGMQNLDKIAIEYAAERTTDERRAELTREYSDEHNRIKREQLKFIIEQKGALASVYALYQRLANDSYLFSGNNDVIYYRTVADALLETYPDSPYHKAVQADIDQFDKINELRSNIREAGYPDLNLKDMYGNEQRLSDLDGKVILLDFWSAQLGTSNQYNAELKEIYAKYKERGFEVYQVAVDNSKSLWINTVQEQKLPWISVSDLKGNSSTVLAVYNITRLPTNMIISKSGDLVERDIYGDALVKSIEREMAK